MDQIEQNMLKKVNQYNLLMKNAIEGPNCINPKICLADCCHIMIDVPKFLAEYYTENDLATKEDFSRGDLFSFKINVTPANSKCVFYDKELNGCSLHSTMHKPPQCWIYPTGFSNDPGEEKSFADDGTIKCKKASGWKIIDVTKTKEAKRIFDDYVAYCENEFAQETVKERIKERLEPFFSQPNTFLL